MGVGPTTNDDFVAFYRRYARTGIHATAAALLTLFGLLASVAGDWAFVAVGVAVYVLPPAYLYATRNRADGETTATETEPAATTPAVEPAASASTDPDQPAADHSASESPATGSSVERSPEHDAARAEESASAADPDGSLGATRNGPAGWRWRPTSPPTDAALFDATAAADGVYVAGAGGVLLARRDGDWETMLENGAGGDGNDLTAVDATTDGRAVWAVGDGGAVTRYDVDAGRQVDHSAPNDLTSTWTGVAVAGTAGEETVYLANGSGVVLRGVLVDGDVTWSEGTKPGSGSSVADLAFRTPKRGVVCDTAGDVLETAGGDVFDRVGVDADGTLTAVVAGDEAGAASDGLDIVVTADDGSLHRRDEAGWTHERPTDAALFDLAANGAADADDGELLAVGADGTVLVDDGDGDGWRSESTPVDATLRGVALADEGTALAVGDGGTAVESRRDTSDEA